jgi:hypothetical protein
MTFTQRAKELHDRLIDFGLPNDANTNYRVRQLLEQSLAHQPATSPNEPITQAQDPLTNAQPVAYARSAQKEDIIRLLNHPLITRQEKTKVLLGVNQLDEERATQMIAKLRKDIEYRENNG